ncbi:MAG: hypothetical protein M3376_12220 [Actinomycetota bacterium]|nr:hypothetical protein [Actinomycetota bacterium]
MGDTFSAISTTRSYRRAQSPEQKIAELHWCGGTQFDPKVVEAIVVVLGRAAPATPAEFLALASYGGRSLGRAAA